MPKLWISKLATAPANSGNRSQPGGRRDGWTAERETDQRPFKQSISEALRQVARNS